MNPRRLPLLVLAAILAVAAPARAGDTPVATDTDLERSVALMARIGYCAGPTFSPDGKRIAFISNLGGSPQIWTVPVEGGWPEPVTASDDPVTGVEWSPSSDWIAYSLAPGGGMNEQIYLVHPDGTGMRRLTDGGKENNRLGGWSPDGRFFTLGSNRRAPEGIDAYVCDPVAGTLRLVSENRGVGGFTDVSDDGGHAILSRTVSRGNNDLFRVDLQTGRETLLTPHEGPANLSGAFAADVRTIYLASDLDRDLRAFVRLDLSADGAPLGSQLLAVRDDAELQGFELDAKRRTAVLLWNVGGRSELEIFDLAHEKRRPVPSLPGEIVGGLVFSPDGRSVAFGCSGASAPTDLWTLDIRRGTLRRLTRSPHAGVDLEQLVQPEIVRYRAHDGLELSGWLYRPRLGQAPYPMVLSFHGGPEGQERPGFNSTYQALLARGIAVFAPNVRGSSGFGKRFVNLDNGALRVDGVADIQSSVAHVVSNGVADPKRIGIMGGSYGGYMVMAGLTEYPDLFAAGANLFGVVNFETFFKHTEPWMAAISTIEYGDPATQADLLRRLSPIHRVDRVVAPTLVLHGANDTNVPVVEAEQVVESLRSRGVPVEYVLFPDEGHGWRKTPNRIRSAVAIVRWFSEHLDVQVATQ